MNDQAIMPAATILLVRDGPTGLEVFMVVRHHQIDFASGALVFPGGKVDANDASVTDLCDGVDGLDDGEICLLYTSPSPRDATLSRMPSSA